ncbi:F-box/FBD/LRR-repeat protein At1g13570-like [Chenopodium quinoa]|uniref:F-box domain-containing protein n=1 Tax=Chenopodium quinoa TaxID=63459 RepID=A0A803L7E7_CHEQI|nr:F-box/FBD/LRR-repeat protein At1g13570-like [Chenopodium quinoa]
MDDETAPDLLSDLPLSIIEIILSLLPIRDAIRMSTLSTKWRYRWASLPQLTFCDKCVSSVPDKSAVENKLIKFITHALFLHKGPIHKFKICTSILQSCPDIDQWLLFLSRNDVRELTLELSDGEWFRVPTCLFSFKKLTLLELCRCELDPPPGFRGFICLRTLTLNQVLVTPEAIESLITNCPLLESLTLSYYDGLDLNVNASNLKYLHLEGEFKDLCLENTPMLEEVSISLYMNTDEIQEHFEQLSGCNFVQFLGGVPNLKRLAGHVYFTKYLSIGIEQWTPSLTYSHLKIIELNQVSFEDMKELLVVLRLITNSPNLQELQISGSSNTNVILEAPNLDFWEAECPPDCTFKQLKTVKMTDMYGVPHEMELIKILLGNSPALEKMSIVPCVYVTELKVDMLVELVRLRRASPLAEIQFIQE